MMNSEKKLSAPSKRKRCTPQRRECHTDLCFSRIQTSVANTREGHQPGSEHARVPLQTARRSKRLRTATGQPQCHCIKQDQIRSKTLSKQLHSSRARAARAVIARGRRQKHVRRSALKARHERKSNQQARYARRDAKDDGDRFGQTLWLEYNRHRLGKVTTRRGRSTKLTRPYERTVSTSNVET